MGVFDHMFCNSLSFVIISFVFLENFTDLNGAVVIGYNEG